METSTEARVNVLTKVFARAMRTIVHSVQIGWSKLGPLVIVFFAWEIFSRLGLLSDFLFPPPSEIVRTTIHLIGPDANPPYVLLRQVVSSLSRLLISTTLGGLVGAMVGFAIGLSGLGRRILFPLFKSIMPVPSEAWLPLFLIVFGLGNRTIIPIVALATTFPVALNTIAGINSVTRQHRWALRSMGASRAGLITRLFVPGALPYTLSGLRLAVGFGWRAMVTAEMLAASSGLGAMVFEAREYLAVTTIYSVILTLIIIGFLSERAIFVPLERRTIERWGMAVQTVAVNRREK